MALSNVCPTDDAIQAFLEYLVFPMLPAKSSVRDNPTSSQQQSVANQVHSVVLLYNYYHRKQHPELPYMPFDEFCKLAVVLKPPLLAHMNFMQHCGETDLIDVEKQLSVAEKMIMDACDICTCLDASKNVPNIEGWPISKVTVLLIDSKKENCFLLFSSITKGVWSLVEKNVDTSSPSSEDTKGTQCYTLKKKRVIRKPTEDKSNVDEAGLLQVGYSAVKEAAGINQTDIVLLESQTVYSHSKEKTTSLFFIMQCSHLINQEIIQVPIKDVINSLQGPLVKKSSSSWIVTPVVEYFHLLPYSEIISKWFSRETFLSSLQNSRVAEKIMGSPKVTESYVVEDMSISLDSKPSSNYTESLKQKENNQTCAGMLSDCNEEPQNMDIENCSVSPSQEKEKYQYVATNIQVCKDSKPSSNITESLKQEENNRSCAGILSDCNRELQNIQVCKDSKPSSNNTESLKQEENNRSCAGILSDCNRELQNFDVENCSVFPFQEKEKCQYVATNVQVCTNQETKNPSVQNYSEGSAGTVKIEKVETTRTLITVDGTNNLAACNDICVNTSSGKNTIDKCNLVTSQSNSNDFNLEKFQTFLASKGKILSQTALTALIEKRNKLALQQRMIEDEIALCDKKIETILTGGEDALELKIESVIEGCNDICVRNQERTSQNLEDHYLSPCIKRKRLSEAVLIMQSPCQELDGICHENNWILPTYRVSQSDGGFEANVSVRGMDFECSSWGERCLNPRAARESAAAQILAKLRNMAKSTQ